MKRFIAGTLLCVSGALCATMVGAQPAATNPCHAFDDPMQRLACYDRATGLPSSPSSQRPGSDAPLPAARPAGPVSSVEPASLLAASWASTPGAERYPLQYHHANYLLVARYTDSVNNKPFSPLFNAAGIPDQELDATEAKFQFSGRLRFWATDDRRWGAWVAYTQQSQWQVYNSDVSRPFRETNYMPEVFVSMNPDLAWGGWRWGLANVGFVHQSNGRADPLSRSWDRVYAQVGADNGNLALSLKVWSRLSEDEKEDDNPDITDYLGHGQLDAVYRWREHSFTGMVRGNVGTGKGAAQVGWFSPRLLGPLRGYVQVFSGYGESMIDYNWRQTTVGVGLALSDGF